MTTCEWPAVTEQLKCTGVAEGEIEVNHEKKQVCRAHFDRFHRLKRIMRIKVPAPKL